MSGPVASWSDSEKIEGAIRRSTKYMPASLGHQVEALLTPENLAIMGGTIAVWAGAHFFGIGEAIDVGLLLVGAFCIGWSMADVMTDLVTFGTTAIRARSDDDLDRAGQAFANAVIVAGITSVMAILLHRSAKEISLRGPSWVDAARPREPGLVDVGPDPQPGQVRTTKIIRDPKLPERLRGTTSWYGDEVRVNTNIPVADQKVTLRHELAHAYLTPRIRFLRTFRVRLMASGYVRTAVLKYLEEAAVQTYGLLRNRGITTLFEGIKFPVKNGYFKLRVVGGTAEEVPIGRALVREGLNFGTIVVGTHHFVVLFFEEEQKGEAHVIHRRR